MALVLGAALALSCGVALAFTNQASAADNGVTINWTIPSTPITSTVTKNSDGELVDAGTPGATTYKVITTWSAGWSCAGPDYVGVSNSTYVAATTRETAPPDLDTLRTSSLVGIWCTDVNESPNAYNWNAFYDLYVDTDEGVEKGLEPSGMGTVANAWDSNSGVYGCLTYRPEFIWTGVLFGADDTATYSKYIREGYYYEGGELTPDDEGYTPPSTEDAAKYYCAGDESYDPYIVTGNTQDAFTYIDSYYAIAKCVDQIIDDYADYNGTDTDWKGMNTLPRTTRYEESATECALAAEKAVRGSTYYVLSKIADGTTSRKTVAFLTGLPDAASDTVTVVAYDYVEMPNSNATNGGYVSFSPLVVDQLTTDTVIGSTVYDTGGVSSGTDEWGNTTLSSNMSYTTYTATADELLQADFIYVAGKSGTVNDVQQWLQDHAVNATTSDIEKVDIICDAIAVMNNSQNWTPEKVIWGIYDVNYFYSELFPNMELIAYWYDNVYHVKSESLPVTMSYALSSADLPGDVSISDLSDSYSNDDMNAKFAAGYDYYDANKTTDGTISRILNGQVLPTSAYEGSAEYCGFEPTDTYAEWAETWEPNTEPGPVVDNPNNGGNTGNGGNGGGTKSTAKKQTIKAKAKVTVKGAKKATVKVKNAKTKLAFKANKKTKKALKIKVKGKKKVIIKAGKKAKKGKTYKVKIFAKASGGYAKSNVVTLKVKVK